MNVCFYAVFVLKELQKISDGVMVTPFDDATSVVVGRTAGVLGIALLT